MDNCYIRLVKRSSRTLGIALIEGFDVGVGVLPCMQAQCIHCCLTSLGGNLLIELIASIANMQVVMK